MNQESPTSAASYWKRKISAYLHDSPNKVLDILGHENSAAALAKAFGFEAGEQFRKDADFAASAADRIPWPKSEHCKSDFHVTQNPFRHPLSGDKIELSPVGLTSRDAEEKAHKTMPVLHQENADEEEHHRLAFLALWRFWQNWASDTDPQLAFYPAETRLPDHTIWSHLGITSAMQGCYGGARGDWDAHQRKNTVPLPDNPALLLFSIGPVQDFIAAARTTRDLWSGSYLLSYLIAQALKRIATDFGPDHVVFPNLKGQPLVDFALKDEWQKKGASQYSRFWDEFDYDSSKGVDALLTPSLPNRFLALLPENMAQHPQWENAGEYAADLAESIKDELSDIAKSVADPLEKLPGFDSTRFYKQVEIMLEINWQIMPVSGSIEEVMRSAKTLPEDDEFKPTQSVRDILAMVKAMPEDHRDKRYFTNATAGSADAPGSLAQPTTAWPVIYALAGWQLDGVKSLRRFDAPNEGTWKRGLEHNKDSLTGREEACLRAPDNEDACEKLRKDAFPGAAKKSIKPHEFLGAATLIKRFWHKTYLEDEERGFVAGDFSMPNTHAIADHRPFDSKSEFNEPDSESSAKYYAVLALDGDQMGKWISGAITPAMEVLLSAEAKTYFAENGNADFLTKHRPLSPSFHLQFSEMLGNFSLHCARRVVEAFDGRLIYAGGDDILAMLPADTAIDCAAALRAAFRGDKNLPELAKGVVPADGGNRRRSDRETPIFQDAPLGCIRLTDAAARKRSGGDDPLVSDPHRFPALVPGPSTDISCGIAIGHIKSPLQDLVKAAQAAEKRAKNELNRGACAVSIFKRSGEITQWGFKWVYKEDRGEYAAVTPLFKTLMTALQDGTLGSRFPYRLAGILTHYLNEGSSADAAADPGFTEKVDEIVRIELDHCMKQHLSGSPENVRLGLKLIMDNFELYWKSLNATAELGGRDLSTNPGAKIRDLIGLCSTLAWINKHQINEA